jgi:hypothetical protein
VEMAAIQIYKEVYFAELWLTQAEVEMSVDGGRRNTSPFKEKCSNRKIQQFVCAYILSLMHM